MCMIGLCSFSEEITGNSELSVDRAILNCDHQHGLLLHIPLAFKLVTFVIIPLTKKLYNEKAKAEKAKALLYSNQRAL